MLFRNFAIHIYSFQTEDFDKEKIEIIYIMVKKNSKKGGDKSESPSSNDWYNPSDNSSQPINMDKEVKPGQEIRFFNGAVLKLSIYDPNLPPDDKKVGLIVSHQNRIQGFLQDTLGLPGKGKLMTPQIGGVKPVPRVSNIELVITGDLNTKFKTGPYFVANDYNSEDSSLQQPYLFSRWMQNYQDKLDKDAIPNVELYIVRHGVAFHNENPKMVAFKGIYDTMLIGGQDEMKAIGTKLQDYMQKNNVQEINQLYTSQLLRSQQTLLYLLNGMQKITKPNYFLILPCLNEKGCAVGHYENCALDTDSTYKTIQDFKEQNEELLRIISDNNSDQLAVEIAKKNDIRRGVFLRNTKNYNRKEYDQTCNQTLLTTILEKIQDTLTNVKEEKHGREAMVDPDKDLLGFRETLVAKQHVEAYGGKKRRTKKKKRKSKKHRKSKRTKK